MVLGIGSGLAYQFLMGEGAQVIARVSPDSQPASSKPIVSSVVVSLKDHPIFRRSRKALGTGESRSIGPDSNVPDVVQVPAPEPPALVGILRGTNGQVRVLMEASGNAGRRLVSQGGDVFGWRIREIGLKHVMVRNRESGTNLLLRLPGASDAEPAPKKPGA